MNKFLEFSFSVFTLLRTLELEFQIRLRLLQVKIKLLLANLL